MEILSLVAAVLLSLVAYSAGSISLPRGRSRPPMAVDLLLAIACAVVAVIGRGAWGHWVGLAAALAIGWTAGILASLLPGRSTEGGLTEGHAETAGDEEAGRWKRFALHLGDFQGRLFLGLLYFIVLAPFGLVMRLASDPLDLRPGSGDTRWKTKEDAGEAEAERLRSQA